MEIEQFQEKVRVLKSMVKLKKHIEKEPKVCSDMMVSDENQKYKIFETSNIKLI